MLICCLCGQELEEDKLNLSSGHLKDKQIEEERLRNTKNTIHARCRQLQKKCDEQQLEIQQLNQQLQQLSQEDEKRLHQQKDVFQKLWKRGLRTTTAMDDRVLEIIDNYERQIYSLRKQLKMETDRDVESDFDEATPNYRALIKSYEKDLRDVKKRLKVVENENELLRLDLQSRPELKDFRATQHRMKSLEKMLKRHNISVTDGKQLLSSVPHSSHVEDLEFLPAAQCRHHLLDICQELHVDDIEDVTPLLRQHALAIIVAPKLEEFAREVLAVVESPGAPVPPEFRSRSPPRHIHEVWCEKKWHHVLPTLGYWRTQLGALKDLQVAVNKLTSMLTPGRVAPLDDDNPSTMKILAAVHAVLADSTDTSQISSQGSREKPSRSVLQGIVDHFMTLFDVAKISGVYARMSDLYTKLGEVHNVMKTLRNLLGLSEDAKSGTVVDTVARLCQGHSKVTAEQVRLLLGVDDLSVVSRKLHDHDEFFPVFQEIMTQLMHLCDVQRMDEVIPTVRALKHLAG